MRCRFLGAQRRVPSGSLYTRAWATVRARSRYYSRICLERDALVGSADDASASVPLLPSLAAGVGAVSPVESSDWQPG